MNSFVIADPKKCIGCYACVAGCVEGHRLVGLQAYPRLFIIHTSVGTMPIQCRHCEDPACASVCPVNAITLQNNSIFLNESLCIGCKMCAIACPFGAIIPGGTPLPDFEFNVGQYCYINSPYQPDPMFLREFDIRDRLSLLNWKLGCKTAAIKCDLCSLSEDGPACVRVCPHKALRLVTEETDQYKSAILPIKAVSYPQDEIGRKARNLP